MELEVHDGGNFVIDLVTDLMMRCHQELKASSEVVFVDTTSRMDQLNTAVTPLLCAGPVGVVPLGIIFSSSQDEISYKRGYPFQVWRWLCDANHRVKKEERQQLILLMKQLVYAKSSVDFENYWVQYCKSSVSQQNDEYTRYFTKLIEKKKEWSIYYPAGRLLRGHHTNNFAESALSIMKDIVLNRSEAYNTCQLVMLMNEVYNSYIKHRLLDVALGCTNIKIPKATKSQIKEIVQVNDFLFEVKSESKEEKYFVDMEIGICDCPLGQTGAICKHQTAYADKYMMHFPQEFKNTPASRQWLFGIALGRKPPLDFFTELQESTVEKVASLVVAGEEIVLIGEKVGSSLLIGEETSSSALATNPDNILCPAVIKTDPEEHIDVKFVEILPPKASKDSMAVQQPSETKLNEFICFIQEIIKDYGDGETDAALERAIKVGRNY
ncbi:hypothetical protein Pcinc_016923 [Petrolisthes cinctipes]|uniref:SWIM-type domain-containing protein n=1 Tax=Petrolisthes cinctipes TaxID=88211 RepID=A0AAE1FPY2_PETCI|nr:hypothetical protein Pcinc_016923 [Petrolisthes cinctipes]